MANLSPSRPGSDAGPGRRPDPGAAADALRGRGVSATPQRVSIYAALRAAMDHPSPEALHARLRGGMPSLSLGTVYKTLHLLAQLGLAHEVSVAGENARRFDGNLAPHHHLVCERCGRVDDAYDPALDRLPAPRRLAGFTPRSVAVQVLGLCAACAPPPARHRVGRARGPRTPAP